MRWLAGARVVRLLVVALAAVLMASCATVPTSGPVEMVTPEVQQTHDQGVRIDPETPRPGASQDRIVAGFMSAMASLQAGFPVARQYLTDTASKQWNPGAETTVIDASSQRVFPSGESQVLTAPIVGRLDAQGRYSAVSGTLRLDFDLVKVGGQWRIGRPPTGLLITTTTFSAYYTSMLRYFLSPSGNSVVPETLRIPAQQLSATAAVQAVLSGPSESFATVMTAVPRGTSLSGSAVSVDQDGTAEVDLLTTGKIPGETQRSQLLAQMAWTVRQVSGVNAVRVTLNGMPIVTPITSGQGVLTLDGQLPRSPIPNLTSTTLIGLRKGVVGRIDPTSGDFTPLGGALAAGKVHPSGVLAATRSGTTVFWISGGELWRGTEQRVDQIAAVTRPVGLQASSDGSVWVVTGAPGQQQLERVSPDGVVSRTPLTSLPAGDVVAFRVAPDLSRVAFVVSQAGDTSELGIVGVTVDRQTSLSTWRGVPLTAMQSGRLTRIADVAWTTPSQLVVLAGGVGDQHLGAYLVSEDAAVVTAVGPADTLDPVRLVVQPSLDTAAILVATREDQLEQVEDVWRWRTVATQLTGVAWAW